MSSKNPRPAISSPGKAAANDELVYFLIKQMHHHRGLPIVSAKITDLLNGNEGSVNKILESYGLIAEYSRGSSMNKEFREQLKHLRKLIECLKKC